MKPRSKGRVRLNDRDPRTPLAVEHGFLADPADADVVTEGIEALRALAASPQPGRYAAREIRPGADVSAAEHTRAAARSFSPSGRHVRARRRRRAGRPRAQPRQCLRRRRVVRAGAPAREYEPHRGGGRRAAPPRASPETDDAERGLNYRQPQFESQNREGPPERAFPSLVLRSVLPRRPVLATNPPLQPFHPFGRRDGGRSRPCALLPHDPEPAGDRDGIGSVLRGQLREDQTDMRFHGLVRDGEDASRSRGS